MKDAAEKTATDIKELKSTTASTCSIMADTNDKLTSLKEVLNLKRRNIRMEAYSRRENIKIFGIAESAGESYENSEELVQDMMRHKMKIPEDAERHSV